MPYKVHKAATKKRAEKKKMRHFVHVRASKALLRVRRRLLYHFSKPLCITISTEGLTQEQIDLLKELERKGLIPRITWITSSPNSINDKVKYALLYLHSDEAKEMGCKIKNGYDYAWIKMAIDHGTIPSPYSNLKHMSTSTFVKYIKKVGFTDIAGSKTLNKFIAMGHWHSNSITFPDIFVSVSECERRNKINMKFLELLNEI